MDKVERKKVRLLPDEPRLVLVVLVSAFLVVAAGLSTKLIVGIIVMYVVAAVTTNLRPIRPRRRR